jgi:hypothetical protein
MMRKQHRRSSIAILLLIAFLFAVGVPTAQAAQPDQEDQGRITTHERTRGLLTVLMDWFSSLFGTQNNDFTSADESETPPPAPDPPEGQSTTQSGGGGETGGGMEAARHSGVPPSSEGGLPTIPSFTEAWHRSVLYFSERAQLKPQDLHIYSFLR